MIFDDPVRGRVYTKVGSALLTPAKEDIEHYFAGASGVSVQRSRLSDAISAEIEATGLLRNFGGDAFNTSPRTGYIQSCSDKRAY